MWIDRLHAIHRALAVLVHGNRCPITRLGLGPSKLLAGADGTEKVTAALRQRSHRAAAVIVTGYLPSPIISPQKQQSSPTSAPGYG